jgi:peptide-O-fucosyltransferase
MEFKLLSEDQELELRLLSFSMDPESGDLSEGEVAVIDQIICSWSAFFLGTPDSTFTLRIFEEREILGFEADLTFNYLCPDLDDEGNSECKQPTKWKMASD